MCGVEKSKQQDLIDHKRNVHNEGTENTPYCDTCKKSFGNKSSLTLHVKSIHQGIFIHNCTICDYKTNSKQQFQSHIKGHGSKEEQKLQKTHKCPNCEKGFFTNALLKKHLNVDTCQIAEKNFECDHCRPSRWFISNPSLVRHIKLYHTHEIQKFKCGFQGCNQLIGSKAALKKHKKWHWDIMKRKEKGMNN